MNIKIPSNKDIERIKDRINEFQDAKDIWITSSIMKIGKSEVSKAKSFNTGEIITIETGKKYCRF